MHILDQLAIKWKQEEESFFLDVEYSDTYVEVDTPIGKKHAWQVDEHDIAKSNNLETIFETNFRNKTHKKFVPLFNMISIMFSGNTFAPPNLDLGEVVLYSEANLTDIISGIEGNFGNNGWIISKKFFNILKEFNIGQYQEYKIDIKSKKKIYKDYVYLHFHNYADKFIEYSKSKFYKQIGFMNFEMRELIDINSFEDIEQTMNQLNKGLNSLDDNMAYIRPKELFLKNCNLDLFKFENIKITDCFMSINLVKRIVEENITGFNLIKTTKVKKI